MKRILLFLLCCPVWLHATNVVWNSHSRNSSESMPCGGGDIGMNVWVENGDLLFYLSRSGTFDENNCQLKQGRFRLHLSPNPFTAADFRQELKLRDGYVEIQAGGTVVQLWADVFHPTVHVELTGITPTIAEVHYENWRYRPRVLRKGEGQQCSYKWAPPKEATTAADTVRLVGAKKNKLLFYHRNPAETVFDVVVAQQGLDSVKHRMMNPLKHLTFGGCLAGDNLQYVGTSDGVYAGTDFRAWRFRSLQAARNHRFSVVLHTAQTAQIHQWEEGLQTSLQRIAPQGKLSKRLIDKDKLRTRAWWNAFQERSYIKGEGEAAAITRNYTLFRYMLGCNAYGSVPTKFNGGLFTFDPGHVADNQSFTPDYRKWGGGTMTAQNQRLVYWPMLKSGDTDMMPSQFDFYQRLLGNAELRSRVYWGHEGACFVEQIENFGLPNPAEYGFKRPAWYDKGLEYNAWLEYQWDTALEFCQMIIETARYADCDIRRYQPLIESTLTFFDRHYRQLASQRGRKELDGNGCLVLFPGSACETYKMSKNASATIAALRTVLENYLPHAAPGDSTWHKMLATIPALPYRYIEVVDSLHPSAPTSLKKTISPAESWERINNTETPQLYPVFPWRIFGVGREGLDIARNTYLYDPDALKFRSHVGWKQDNIWAACLGLTHEARRLALEKLGDGPHRFPAFWGPGFDWTPDHNHGGSGMIGLQEMLLQTAGQQIILFPAWPKEWNVQFKLHAPGNTLVEATLANGQVTQLKVTPEHRKKDILIHL